MFGNRGIAKSIINGLESRADVFIISTLIITTLLSFPMIFMSAKENASLDPAGEVFDLQVDVNDRFEEPFHSTAFIVEAIHGDVLTQASLWELYRNSQRLLELDELGELAPPGLPAENYLYDLYDPNTNRNTIGIVASIADATQKILTIDPRLNTSLEHATDNQVKIALDVVFDDPLNRGLRAYQTENTTSEIRTVDGYEINYWISPSTIFSVLSYNDKLGGGTYQIGVGGGKTIENKEHFNRNIQKVLRGDQVNYHLWGVAIDVNLESIDEGQIAGIFIMLTVIAAVLIIWVSLKSYWAMVLTGSGLCLLIVWLKGISALIGLKSGLVIDMIVPIAMISLGVDFAVHAIRRYQEEKSPNNNPGTALKLAFTGVIGALTLAMFSDGIAFLANASSDIEAVVHFGIAAAIAVSSSFLILGIVVPLALMRIEQFQPVQMQSDSVLKKTLNLGKGLGAAILFGGTVILLIAVSKVAGLILLLLGIIIFLFTPMYMMRRRYVGYIENRALNVHCAPTKYSRFNVTSLVEITVTKIVKYSIIVLIVTALATSVCIWLALKLQPTFDVKDFFDNKSDFVMSLDKLDYHVGTKAGEPGIVYIKGDLTDPDTLVAIKEFVSGLTEIPLVARSGDDEVLTGDHVISFLDYVMSNDYALTKVTQKSGLVIKDDNGDGIPNTALQLKAIYNFIIQYGIPLDDRALRFNSDQIQQRFYHDPKDMEENVAILEVPIVGSREQANITTASKALESRLTNLETMATISLAGLTGSPFTRDAQLRASTNTLQTSIPIAAAGAFILLLIAMRSVRYSIVTIIPIGLVVVWLYGLMYIGGFALNLVTATIGAVSVGVGIDYSIHMTERFREELNRTYNKLDAIRKAARGTGVALVTSAVSSIVGFSILGFAPMPMFASYGQLTALMMFLALVASLVVLPPLLLLITPTHTPTKPDY